MQQVVLDISFIWMVQLLQVDNNLLSSDSMYIYLYLSI